VRDRRFSSDLRAALLEASSAFDVGIASIVRDATTAHPPEVLTTIRQDVLSDYAAAAEELSSRVDAVLIEHEFGIFEGDAGDFVLTLARGLTVPLVVTLHTVLSAPSVEQASVLRGLCERASIVTVFTETARRMVVEGGLVDAGGVVVVPHGAPDRLSAAPPLASEPGFTRCPPVVRISDQTRGVLDRLEGRTVLATFGLISASKGLELAIEALPSIVASRPDASYLIAGQTHPEVAKHDGERYRLQLERLVRDLELTDHVLFLDRFLDVEELAVLLARTDLYLTPYASREQIVSGALTFAVAAGCAVVSTPYLYAEDLLQTGAGLLVPFGDGAALAATVLELLRSPARLAAARAEARRIGAGLSWRRVGEATAQVLATAVGEGTESGRRPHRLASSGLNGTVLASRPIGDEGVDLVRLSGPIR